MCFSAVTPQQTKRADLCRNTKPTLDPQPSEERKKTMASHSSASTREPHAKRTTRTNIILNALTRRAQAVLNDESIDAESRAIIRYAIEINDPWLERLVRRAEAGEEVVDNMKSLNTEEEEKISALAEIVCRAGEQTAAALLVLMAKIERASHPRALANTAKQVAFTRRNQLNFGGMFDAQIAMLESKLLCE